MRTSKDFLKIAQIAPIVESVPPKKYGGTERVVHGLTEELVKRGHDVTLFASGDSVTSAKLISVFPRSLREAKIENIYGMNAWSLLNFGMAYQISEQFDIIHDHTNELSLPTANLSNTPVVVTLHGAITPQNKRLYEFFKKINYVTISDAQGSGDFKRIATVHNGLNMSKYPFLKKPGNYLLYIGRISPEKGVHIAIEAAQLLNMPLIIAAKLDSSFPPDIAYFRDMIAPKLSEEVRWIGEVDEEERNKLMAGARAFLHPATWKEPFGLTLIESMACGTPVIAFRVGSIPEIIVNGKTGYIVDDLEGMISAILNIGQIDRLLTRKYALKNFSAEKMTDEYIRVYAQILGKEKDEKFKSSAAGQP